jgi:hypothetical protein
MVDFQQRAMAELTRYRGLLRDRWAKVPLFNVVVAPRWMHKARLLGGAQYWHYVDKVFHDFI